MVPLPRISVTITRRVEFGSPEARDAGEVAEEGPDGVDSRHATLRPVRHEPGGSAWHRCQVRDPDGRRLDQRGAAGEIMRQQGDSDTRLVPLRCQITKYMKCYASSVPRLALPGFPLSFGAARQLPIAGCHDPARAHPVRLAATADTT